MKVDIQKRYRSSFSFAVDYVVNFLIKRIILRSKKQYPLPSNLTTFSFYAETGSECEALDRFSSLLRYSMPAGKVEHIPSWRSKSGLSELYLYQS